MRNWRYAPVEPAMAPPRRYVNSRVKMIGLKTASKSCSGTCFIFEQRPPPERERGERAFGRFGLSPEESAERSASSAMCNGGVGHAASSSLSSVSAVRRYVR